MMNQVIDVISSLFFTYKKIIFNSLDEYEKQKYSSYMNKTIDENLYTNSLFDLCKYLKEYYNEKCLILIDEYDAPLQNAYDEGFYDDIHLFFKTLFSKTLKSNQYLNLGVIFGITEVSKGSLFSGLNNIIVNTILSHNDEEFFGFTEDDVTQLFNLYNINDDLKNIKEWYGGYSFSQKEIYNPWSILNFIKNRDYNFYWINTGSNPLISSLLKNDTSDFVDILPDLISKNIIIHRVDLSLSNSDIKTSKDAIISYLLSAGYLTIVERLSPGIYSLKFPNEEIKQLFITEIKNRFIKSNDGVYLPIKLKEAIKNNNVNEIEDFLTDYFLTNFSYFDFDNEKNYQILILTIVSLLFEDYIIQSEENTGDGRCDIMISSKKYELGFIFEIKYSKTILSLERLKKIATSSLNQIENKNYIEKLLKQNQNHIIIYGVGFQKKKVSIVSKIIK